MRLPVDAKDFCIGNWCQKVIPWRVIASVFGGTFSFMFLLKGEIAAVCSQTWTSTGSSQAYSVGARIRRNLSFVKMAPVGDEDAEHFPKAAVRCSRDWTRLVSCRASLSAFVYLWAPATDTEPRLPAPFTSPPTTQIHALSIIHFFFANFLVFYFALMCVHGSVSWALSAAGAVERADRADNHK